MLKRPRRNRRSPAIRSLVRENVLRPEDLVAPFFVIEGSDKKEPIEKMPGIFRFSVDRLVDEVKFLYKQGIQAIALFSSLPKHLRTEMAIEALNPEGPVAKALRILREEVPGLCLISDIALDPFTSHGHDGIVIDGDVDNERTVEVLMEMSLLHAKCGADFVAPSDMMDGRVLKIRQALDKEGYLRTGILSYCAKYNSSLYAPFRDALNSSFPFLDKRTYQMDPANVREAIREARLDEEEGADILMVKPALLYLDVIRAMKEESPLPICAFHVSGEYSMVMAAHEKGFLDADKVFLESLLSIKRAGADFIITYAASRLLPLLA
jgi:porphobilinogen synthase